MKKILIALASVAALALFAAETPAAVNKVVNKNWWPLRSKTAGEVVNVDTKTGLIEVVNVGKDAKGKDTCTGAVQGITLNQTAVRAVKVGVECKAEDVKGAKSNNFALYMDVFFMEGKPLYGQCIQFTPGTHDWEKLEKTFTFPKPVKSINFYVFLRYNTGKASFRNIYLNEL